MRICVLGLGYVGAVSAACLAADGHTVIGVDPNLDKVDLINDGRSPIVETGLAEMVAEQVVSGRLRATPAPAEAIGRTELALVCVGTPGRDNGSLDLTHLERACTNLGAALAERDGYYAVVVRSTVLPGTCARVVIPTIERWSGRRHGIDFGVVMHPEFLREGSAVADFGEPPKVVIGGDDRRAGDLVAALAPDRAPGPLRTSLEVAEIVKYVDNSWHALKVAFANEVGRLCRPLGIDSHQVMDIFGGDTKLNISTAYLRPGMPFGGSCLPKDLQAITHQARLDDVDLPVLSSVAASNEAHLATAVKLVLDSGARHVALLGLSFKSGTDDLRGAPMVELAERLLGKGIGLRIHDRDVGLARLTGSNQRYVDEHLPHIDQLLVDDMDQALDGAEAVVVGDTGLVAADLTGRLAPGVQIIDLVRIAGTPAGFEHYQGLVW